MYVRKGGGYGVGRGNPDNESLRALVRHTTVYDNLSGYGKSTGSVLASYERVSVNHHGVRLEEKDGYYHMYPPRSYYGVDRKNEELMREMDEAPRRYLAPVLRRAGKGNHTPNHTNVTAGGEPEGTKLINETHKDTTVGIEKKEKEADNITNGNGTKVISGKGKEGGERDDAVEKNSTGVTTSVPSLNISANSNNRTDDNTSASTPSSSPPPSPPCVMLSDDDYSSILLACSAGIPMKIFVMYNVDRLGRVRLQAVLLGLASIAFLALAQVIDIGGREKKKGREKEGLCCTVNRSFIFTHHFHCFSIARFTILYPNGSSGVFI